jgi:predicted ABC-type ATPase
MPVLFIITGSNGAGKSVVGYTYLPEEIQKKYQKITLYMRVTTEMKTH